MYDHRLVVCGTSGRVVISVLLLISQDTFRPPRFVYAAERLDYAVTLAA
jgi:hypothetical protein